MLLLLESSQHLWKHILPPTPLCAMSAPAAHLDHLAGAIRACTPGDAAGSVGLKQALTDALEACDAGEPATAEALLSCLLETFTACGDQGKAVLDDMLLELLPPITNLAERSAACDRLLAAFCSLAAGACTPRDTITAFLEVLDNLVQDSPSPDRLQFACNLLLMLPEQVAKLSRRKTAHAVECCCAAATLAQVHGQVLEGWMLHQLAQAAQQRAQGAAADSEQTSQRLDTFLAATWQAYVEFAEEMVKQVLQQATEADALEAARQGLSTLVLQLLQHLTGLWQPPALRPLAMQLLSGPSAAQLMPSSESIAPPAPALATRGSSQAHSKATDADSSAEAAVLDLLQVLQACDVQSWQQLQHVQGTATGGAGLAALYSCCSQDGVLAVPDDVVTVVQLACRWGVAVSETLDGNVLAILKAVALLQLAAAHAKQLCTADGQPSSSRPAVGASLDADGPVDPEQTSAASTATLLLPDLQPCITMLAGVMSQAPAQVLRTQASLTLQQLLQALPQPVCYACLQQLLAGGAAGSQVHAEVAALLLQEVRALLVNATPGSCFTPASCMQLAMPWLLQQGPVGWQSADALPDGANAVCAALAVTRLVLLRVKAGSIGVDRQELKAALSSMAAAVRDALAVLQAANSTEQEGQQSLGSSAGDGRVCVPGEAQGAGQAVDAWLAVSRVQDVLDRVLELL